MLLQVEWSHTSLIHLRLILPNAELEGADVKEQGRIRMLGHRAHEQETAADDGIDGLVSLRSFCFISINSRIIDRNA
jgi:hypothetical protein